MEMRSSSHIDTSITATCVPRRNPTLSLVDLNNAAQWKMYGHVAQDALPKPRQQSTAAREEHVLGHGKVGKLGAVSWVSTQ